MKRVPVLFLVLLSVLALVAAVLVPRALRAWNDPDRPANVERDIEGCERSLAQLASALEKHFDEQKRYPNRHDDGTATDAEALRQALVPRYLPELPKCPRAGVDTYSATYTGMRVRFEAHCSKGHPGLFEGLPRTDESGLVTRKDQGRYIRDEP